MTLRSLRRLCLHGMEAANQPSPNRSIPPIHSSWLDRAATPISLFNERRLPIKPNAPQTQKRPMRTARPTALDPGHHLIAMASPRLSDELADAK
jgi:hypothetical protein